MKTQIKYLTYILFAFLLLTGCNTTTSKSSNYSYVYGTMVIFSLLLLIGYHFLIENKDIWFYLLLSSVAVVNIGYLTLSVSKSLEEALLCNRIAYLGSVFLPFSMLMIILNLCGFSYKKYIPYFLLPISIIVFIVAASPGYSDIYYKNATLKIVNGVATLHKTYGPLHSMYMIYLLVYFLAMIMFVFYASLKKKIQNFIHALFLLTAVFINICVWLLSRVIHFDFELLSISYVISEFFLLAMYLMLQNNHQAINTIEGQENNHLPPESKDIAAVTVPLPKDSNTISKDQLDYFTTQLIYLTPTERIVYNYYLSGKTTKEILELMNIKENTLKYHNKNIYSKLGVFSRRQLIEYGLEAQKNNSCKIDE